MAQLELVRIFNIATKFEVQKYYQNEPKFNGVYSRNNLSKLRNGSYVINLDKFKPVVTQWIALYVNGINIIYFDSFGVENVLKEIKKIIRRKNITNIYGIPVYDSIICGYFCTGFIDFIISCYLWKV